MSQWNICKSANTKDAPGLLCFLSASNTFALKVLESRRLLKHQTLTYVSRPCTLKVILSFNCCRNSCAIETALTSSGHAVMNFNLNVLMLISSLVKFNYWEVKRTESSRLSHILIRTHSLSLSLSLSPSGLPLSLSSCHLLLFLSFFPFSPMFFVVVLFSSLLFHFLSRETFHFMLLILLAFFEVVHFIAFWCSSISTQYSGNETAWRETPTRQR